MGSAGVLSQLIEAGLTEHVTDWYGCSAGSFCALFGAIGGSATWIREIFNVFDGRLAFVVREDYICDFTKTWGVASSANVSEMFGKLVDTWESGCSSWTFADLSNNRPGSRIHILAANITTGKPMLFNAENSPDILILEAIRASVTIPLLFSPWVHPITGDLYCDGALVENYPWLSIPNKDDTLVVVCSDKNITGRTRDKHQINNMIDYLTQVLSVARRREAPLPKFWIAVNTTIVSLFDFYTTKELRLGAFEDGVRSAKGWLAFRESMLNSPGETSGSRSGCEPPNTSCAGHPLSGKMSDSRQSHNPMQQSGPPLDLHKQKRHSARRWSL